MKRTPEFWQGHVEAAKHDAIPTSGYARLHGGVADVRLAYGPGTSGSNRRSSPGRRSYQCRDLLAGANRQVQRT
jgi:hypothetical protein